MEKLIAGKDFVALWTGLDHDALQLFASVPILLLGALVLRRPLSQPAPWVFVLVGGLVSEAVFGFADGAFTAEELVQSRGDLLLLMAFPTLILVLARYFPRALGQPPANEGIQVPMARDPWRHTIVDADYEEITER
jgi:hypothetical protein